MPRSRLACWASRCPAEAANKPVTLVLEWTGIQPQHFGFWLAKERGWYGAEGLDVTVKGSGGSAQAMQIVVGGQAEFGNIAASSLVQAAGKSEVPLRMVAVFGQRNSLSMAYFESSGIKQPKDLEGRKLGMVPGSMAHILWPSFAKATGIDVAKVQIVNWDFRSYYGIFGAKQVDASGNFTLGSTGSWLFKQKGETVRQFVFVGLPAAARQRHRGAHGYAPERPRHGAAFRARDPARVDLPCDRAEEGGARGRFHREAGIRRDAAREHHRRIRLRDGSGPHGLGRDQGQAHGLVEPADWEKMIALLKGYDASMTRQPVVAELMTNDYLAQ